MCIYDCIYVCVFMTVLMCVCIYDCTYVCIFMTVRMYIFMSIYVSIPSCSAHDNEEECEIMKTDSNHFAWDIIIMMYTPSIAFRHISSKL